MLAFFIPAIVYLADAVGTQTETVVVRGLSVGVTMSSMVVREWLTGFAIGLALAAVAGRSYGGGGMRPTSHSALGYRSSPRAPRRYWFP